MLEVRNMIANRISDLENGGHTYPDRATTQAAIAELESLAMAIHASDVAESRDPSSQESATGAAKAKATDTLSRRRFVMNADDYEHLIRGGTLSICLDPVSQLAVQICLNDIGFSKMAEIQREALADDADKIGRVLAMLPTTMHEADQAERFPETEGASC